MSFINQYRAQLKQHTTSTLLLSALIIFTVLLVILRLSLSAIIIFSTEKWLASQQLDASIERIEISLFSGRVALHNAEAQNAQQQGFKVGELTLDWNWLPLFSKQVDINQITLRDFSINAEQLHDGEMNIGGIRLPAKQAVNDTSATIEEDKTPASLWQASIHGIELNNIEACVAQLDQDNNPVLDYCSQLEQFQWQGALAYLPEAAELQNTPPALPLHIDGRFDLKTLRLHNNLLELDLADIEAISLANVKVESLANIQLQQLDISHLAILQQGSDDSTEPAIETTNTHLLAFEHLTLGPVSIMQMQKIALGDIELRGLRSQARIKPDNQLDIDAWIPAQMTQDTDQQPTDTDNKAEENTQGNNETMLESAQQSGEPQVVSSNSTEEKTLHLAINNIQLSDTGLCTVHSGNEKIKPLHYCLTLGNAHWLGSLAYSEQTHKTEDTAASSLPVYANGQFELNQLHLKNRSLDLNLLSVNQIKLDEVAIQSIEHIDIAAFTIKQFASFERVQPETDNSTESSPYIFAFDQFSVQPVKLSPNEIRLGTAKLTGSQAYIVIDQQGEAEIEQWLVQTGTTDASPAVASTDNQQPAARTQKTSETAQNTPRFLLDDFIFDTDKKSTFIDRSGQQLMQLVIEQIEIHLQDIDSTGEQQTTASLLIKLEDQATLKLNAEGTPLADKPGIKGTASISALDLRQISPLTRQQLGQNIRSGQLDAQLDITIDKGLVDSLLDIKLHHFVLRTLNDEEAEKLNKNLGFPLNTSLNLLRDKDNRIHLSIPITQDVDDLNIDIKPVIYKALSKSVSSAIVNYYTPFGLVFVAESLFDLATALKFKPVLFNPGETALTEASKAELEKLATIMNERPGIHLTLCGFSNSSDISQATTNTTNQPTADKPAIEISPEQRQQLIQLGEARSSVVKQYLVNTHQISASRLVECEAEYAADAIAGVEIKL